MRKNTNIYSISGISAEKGYIYKWLDYNKFEKKPTEIPKGYRKVKLSKDWIKEFGCGNRKRIEEITWDKSFHKGYTTYLIHDNGGRPFLVAIKGKKVKIYRIDPKIYSYTDKIQKYYYTYLINEYTTKKIFIGKSAKKLSRDMSEAKKASKSRTIEQLKKDFVKVAKKLKIPEKYIKSKIDWFKYNKKPNIENLVLYYEMKLTKLEKKQKK
jgi:hypothetical protein